jgi:hypothetical protein
VDIDAYYAGIRGAWRGIGYDALDRLAVLGRALWSLSGIPGQRPTLVSPWANRTIGKLTYYHEEVSAALARLKWEGSR